jgi:membrane fusion protein (multidrug efflux system)
MSYRLKGCLKLLLTTLVLPNISFAEQLEARGVVQPLEKATLSAQISSRITSLPYRTGDSFKKGSALVKLDCAMFVAQKEMVSAQLQSAKYKLENDEKLSKLRSIGELEVQMSKAEVRKHQAELKMADINTQRCTIAAPWNGHVAERLVEPYENVEINQPLMKVVTTEEMEIELLVPAAWLKWLKPGKSFNYTVDETGESFPAKVHRLVPAVDTASHTMMVRARFDRSSGLLPGMSGSAWFDQP